MYGDDLLPNLPEIEKQFEVRELRDVTAILYPRRAGKTKTETIASGCIVVSQPIGNNSCYNIGSRQARDWLQESYDVACVFKTTAEFGWELDKANGKEFYQIRTVFGTLNRVSSYPGIFQGNANIGCPDVCLCACRRGCAGGSCCSTCAERALFFFVFYLFRRYGVHARGAGSVLLFAYCYSMLFYSTPYYFHIIPLYVGPFIARYTWPVRSWPASFAARAAAACLQQRRRRPRNPRPGRRATRRVSPGRSSTPSIRRAAS